MFIMVCNKSVSQKRYVLSRLFVRRDTCCLLDHSITSNEIGSFLVTYLQ